MNIGSLQLMTEAPGEAGSKLLPSEDAAPVAFAQVLQEMKPETVKNGKAVVQDGSAPSLSSPQETKSKPDDPSESLQVLGMEVAESFAAPLSPIPIPSAVTPPASPAKNDASLDSTGEGVGGTQPGIRPGLQSEAGRVWGAPSVQGQSRNLVAPPPRPAGSGVLVETSTAVEAEAPIPPTDASVGELQPRFPNEPPALKGEPIEIHEQKSVQPSQNAVAPGSAAQLLENVPASAPPAAPEIQVSVPQAEVSTQEKRSLDSLSNAPHGDTTPIGTVTVPSPDESPSEATSSVRQTGSGEAAPPTSASVVSAHENAAQKLSPEANSSFASDLTDSLSTPRQAQAIPQPDSIAPQGSEGIGDEIPIAQEATKSNIGEVRRGFEEPKSIVEEVQPSLSANLSEPVPAIAAMGNTGPDSKLSGGDSPRPLEVGSENTVKITDQEEVSFAPSTEANFIPAQPSNQTGAVGVESANSHPKIEVKAETRVRSEGLTGKNAPVPSLPSPAPSSVVAEDEETMLGSQPASANPVEPAPMTVSDLSDTETAGRFDSIPTRLPEEIVSDSPSVSPSQRTVPHLSSSTPLPVMEKEPSKAEVDGVPQISPLPTDAARKLNQEPAIVIGESPVSILSGTPLPTMANAPSFPTSHFSGEGYTLEAQPRISATAWNALPNETGKSNATPVSLPSDALNFSFPTPSTPGPALTPAFPLAGADRPLEAKIEARAAKDRGTEPETVLSVASSSLPHSTPAPTTAAPPTTVSEPRHVAPEIVVNQVARALKAVVKEANNEVVIRLDPPDMGHIKIKLTSEMGGISASFHAESDAVKAILQTNLPALHTAMTEAGISVQQMTLSARSDFDLSGRQPGDQQPPTRRRNPSGSSTKDNATPIAPLARSVSRRAGLLDLFA
jgi:flagellar hook-length control protein FliK